MEIYYSSLPATLKTVMAKNKEKMDNNVLQNDIDVEDPVSDTVPVQGELMDPVKSFIQADIHCHHGPSRRTYGRRKSGIGSCPICEEEKGKRLECSDDGSSYIVYYYGNASQSKTDQQKLQRTPVKEEASSEIPANSSPPLVARASSVIYYSQASLE